MGADSFPKRKSGQCCQKRGKDTDYQKKINTAYSSGRHSYLTTQPPLTQSKETKCPVWNSASPRTSFQLRIMNKEQEMLAESSGRSPWGTSWKGSAPFGVWSFYSLHPKIDSHEAEMSSHIPITWTPKRCFRTADVKVAWRSLVLQDSAKLLTLERRPKKELKQSAFGIHVTIRVPGVCGRGWGGSGSFHWKSALKWWHRKPCLTTRINQNSPNLQVCGSPVNSLCEVTTMICACLYNAMSFTGLWAL